MMSEPKTLLHLLHESDKHNTGTPNRFSES